MYDLIIVGGGPAGLSAAVYASRAGKKTLVLEKSVCGGQIINAHKVENYPGIKSISGSELAFSLYDQATSFGCEIASEEVTDIKLADDGVKVVITESGEYEAYAVIIATGASGRKLGVENEERFVGKGVSYCATCDGAFFKNKTVAVVGGGNTALDDAMYLSEFCKEVILIHRREEFRGDVGTLERLKERDNVRIITSATVTALNGEERLASIEITNRDGVASVEEVSGIFIAIGVIPATKAFTEIVGVDETGYFQTDETCVTDKPGIFVAGDCRQKNIRQLATAVSDGVVSALAAISYITEHHRKV